MANTCMMGYFLSSNFIFFNRYLFTVRRLSIQIFIPCNDKKKQNYLETIQWTHSPGYSRHILQKLQVSTMDRFNCSFMITVRK